MDLKGNIKIETSLGIVEIPLSDLNKYDLKNKDWVEKLPYYRIQKLETDYDSPGWIFVNLEDGYYGSPEYKILPPYVMNEDEYKEYVNELNEVLEIVKHQK